MCETVKSGALKVIGKYFKSLLRYISVPISKEASLYVKGGAILLMLIAHMIPESCVPWHSFNIFTGVCCLGFFAFLTGCAHFVLSERFICKSAWAISGTSFWKFYKKYLVCCLLMIPLFLAIKRIGLYDALWIVVPIKSYLLTDSWWYVFCHAVFCFALFPAVRFGGAKLSMWKFIIFISALLVCLVLLPLTFNNPHYPQAFRQVWGSVPILRTVLIVPYYLMGYAYGKCVHEGSNAAVLSLAFTLALYSLFPFSLYGISGIAAINIGIPFIVCALVMRVMYRFRYIQSLLRFLGVHSVYIWFFHMPMYIGYIALHLPANQYFRFIVVLVSSLACSVVLQAVGKRLSRHFSA